MSLNKAQFQVAFNRADALDNLKSATIAAKGRDKMLANLNRMSNLDNPWAKMTAYSALSRFAPVYQQEQIEKLGGGSDLQKTYMKDIGEYFAEKTANRKREQELAFKVEQAKVFGEPIQSAGGSNIDVTFAGGQGSGWAVGEEGSLTYYQAPMSAVQELARRLAEGQAYQEISPGAFGGGEAAEVPQALEPVKKKKTSKATKAKTLTFEQLQEEREQLESLARVRGDDPQAFAEYMMEEGRQLPSVVRRQPKGVKAKGALSEISAASTLPVFEGMEFYQSEGSAGTIRRQQKGVKSRGVLSEISAATTEVLGTMAGLASFEQPAEFKGMDPDDIIAAALARAPPPDDIIMDEYIAYRDYLMRYPSTGTYKKFRKEQKQSFVSASGGGPAMGFGGLWR